MRFHNPRRICERAQKHTTHRDRQGGPEEEEDRGTKEVERGRRRQGEKKREKREAERELQE